MTAEFPEVILFERLLDFELQKTGSLNIGATHTPRSIARRFDRHGSAFHYRAEVPVTVIAFETDSRRAIGVAGVQDKNEITERECGQPLILKLGFYLPNPIEPVDSAAQIS